MAFECEFVALAVDLEEEAVLDEAKVVGQKLRAHSQKEELGPLIATLAPLI